MSFDAIVLCGGSARRLDGADKKTVVVGGMSLLDRAVAAVGDAVTIIAVGPAVPTTADVIWTRERPPGGGPVAGLAAGLPLATQPLVVVLGVDFPFVDRPCIERLVAAAGDGDGAILADGSGRLQFLVAAYKRAALIDSLADRDPSEMAMGELVADLSLEVLDDPRAGRDCDTWEEVIFANELIEREMS